MATTTDHVREDGSTATHTTTTEYDPAEKYATARWVDVNPRLLSRHEIAKIVSDGYGLGALYCDLGIVRGSSCTLQLYAVARGDVAEAIRVWAIETQISLEKRFEGSDW